MHIEIRKPSIRVMLYKNVGRSTVNGSAPTSQRFAGEARYTDLTPFLAENGSVQVSKSVREPCGAFSITLSDRIDWDIQDTIYAAIEPMDSIEISISGSGFQADRNGPPIMMRGLVAGVQRLQGMSAEGKPTRQVVISGQDYGKILQIMQVFMLPFGPDAANLITSFPFFAKFGEEMVNMDSSAFTQAVFDKVVNPFVVNMRKNPDGAVSDSHLLPFSTDIQVPGACVSPSGVGSFNGRSIANIFQAYGDIGCWNEFFVEDRADGPYAVYRPNPYMDIVTQQLIMPGVKMPAIVDIDRSDIISITASRSDQNIGNYFWVDSARFNANYDFTSKALAFQSSQVTNAAPFYVTKYGNVDPTLYGVRKMDEPTNQAGETEENGGNGTAGGARIKNQGAAIDWINLRRQQLYDLNKDNVLFESGSMRLKGNENIKAGTYLRAANGNLVSLYYIVSVTHSFIPFGSYLTEVQFERGTNFADRLQRGVGQDSPYLAEMVTTG